jgi:hypothetical protein
VIQRPLPSMRHGASRPPGWSTAQAVPDFIGWSAVRAC